MEARNSKEAYVGARKVLVTVCYWEKTESTEALRVSRTLPMPSGCPVIWVWGRFAVLFRSKIASLLHPDQDLRFRMKGNEVFWFSPVDETSVLDVIASC